MTKKDLLNLVGEKVTVYFKDRKKSISGYLGYAESFSEKYRFIKPNYFFINNISFKISHIKKIELCNYLSRK